MSDNDEIFFPDKGEEVKPKACLMHPHKPCVHVYKSGEIMGYVGILYGLCKACIDKLKIDRTYVVTISMEIEERLKKLKGENNVGN